jgi:hypothetical protein
MSPFLRLALVALVATATLTACDQTDDLTSGSEAQLLENARVARTAGDYETAIRVLDAAREAYPASAAVRVEYAITLFDRDDVNLIDLDRVASFLTDAAGTAPAAPAPSPTMSVGPSICPYVGNPTFDPTSYAGFPQLEADAAVIAQTLALLDPVIPDAIQNFGLCTAVTDGPDGPALNYAPAAALAEMRALGLSDEQIAAALATNGLARFLHAYLTVTTALTQETTWYRIDGGSRVGVCADDPARLQDEAEDAVEDLGEAVFSLDLRGVALDNPILTQDLVELMLEGYTEVRDGIGRYCTPD